MRLIERVIQVPFDLGEDGALLIKKSALSYNLITKRIRTHFFCKNVVKNEAQSGNFSMVFDHLSGRHGLESKN